MSRGPREQSGTKRVFARFILIVETRLSGVLQGAEIDRKGLDSGLGPRARRVWSPLTRALTATGDHWTLPIAVALAPGRMRVTQLQGRLPGLSAGVLERHVQQMVALGLVTRTRFKEMPPRVELELTDVGRELVPVAGALARWGARHLWSAPLEREQVDVGALLHLLPLLLEEAPGLPRGSVEVVVEDSDPPLRRYYRVDKGHLRIDDAAKETIVAASKRPSATAREPASFRGDSDAWVAALGPACDCSRLRVSGDQRLARRILDTLGG